MNIKCAVGPALAFLLIATPIVAAEEPDPAQAVSMPTTPNTILIVDRYDNVKRVTEMIRRMDSLTPSQTDHKLVD